jgi:membrane protease YdiL (CAAX protease family)
VSALGKIFLYLVLVLLVGSLAAPQAWALIQHLPPDWFGGLLSKVQGMPFRRYFSRSLQVTSLVFLWPLLRSLRIRSLGEFGLVPNHRPVCDAVLGLSAGLFGMALLGGVQLLAGTSLLDSDWLADVRSALPRMLVSALIVSGIEEFLFRGVLLGFLRQFLDSVPAIILSALVFSLLHFTASPLDATTFGDAPNWASGLYLLSKMVAGFGSGPQFGYALIILFTAGLILGWLTVRTGSLWSSIGLHGAWIFGQQSFNSAAHYAVNPPTGLLPFLGPSQCNGMVPTGLLPLTCLLLAGTLAGLLLRGRERPAPFVARRS